MPRYSYLFFALLLLCTCHTPDWEQFDFSSAEKLVAQDKVGDSLTYLSLGEVHYLNTLPQNVTWREIQFTLGSEVVEGRDPQYNSECVRISKKIQPLLQFLVKAHVNDYYRSRDGSFVEFWTHFNQDTWAYEGFIYQQREGAPVDSMLFPRVFSEGYSGPGKLEKIDAHWYKFADFYSRNNVYPF